MVSLVQTVYLQVRFSHTQSSLMLKLPNFFQVGKDLENVHTNHKNQLFEKLRTLSQILGLHSPHR